MRAKVMKILRSELKEVMKMNNYKLPKKIDEKMGLIGKKGRLDSLSFVTFLIVAEQKLKKEFKKPISLNNEKAFSQKYSPFRTLGALGDYIMEKI